MLEQILATKLYTPQPRSSAVIRPRLIDRLDAGLHGKVILVSAPAGFGKTTLVTEWVSDLDRSVAWLSLDAGDSEASKFVMYVVAALQTVMPELGHGLFNLLQSPQVPPIQSLMTPLLNEIAAIPHEVILVMDDYHSIDNPEIDAALAFLIDNQPPQLHLVITTREDPNLPLARLRARGDLTEIRATDLRFTTNEATDFLNTAMGLSLSSDDVVALEQRTEGWIVGLQLAAISLQQQTNATDFIQSFTGSHHFVLDYLIAEVLSQQPPQIRDFLLKTSILERLCGPLCAAILQDEEDALATLERIRQANLFLIPLDNERKWFRYHYLFADLLRQRLLRDSTDFSLEDVKQFHTRASIWYETNGLEIAAFQHAIASDDIERAERLIESQGTPMYLRGIVKPILQWLDSLPQHTLDQHPSLWFAYASTLLLNGQHTLVEQTLTHADNALKNAEQNATTRDIMGRIASMRGTLAVIQNDVEAMIAHSDDALSRLHPDNFPIRIASQWTRGYAYQLQGNHQLARHAYEDVLQLCESGENSFYAIVATISLGQLKELDNQLHQASERYQNAIQLSGDQPIASQAFLGLARIHYQWNDLEAAQAYGKQCHECLQHMEQTDTTASYKVFLAYVYISQNDFTKAYEILDEAEAFVHQHHFLFRMPDIVEAQVRVLIHRVHLTNALELAEVHNLPISQARICLAQESASRALQILTPFTQKAKETGSQYEYLKGLILQAIIYHVLNQPDAALKVLGESLTLAKHSGFIRIFLDEGIVMRELLSQAVAQDIFPTYSQKILTAFESHSGVESSRAAQPLVDTLSERELEILRLIAEGLSNREISERLFVALDTVKGHNRNIYQKLQVKRRTEAVARARELGLI